MDKRSITNQEIDQALEELKQNWRNDDGRLILEIKMKDFKQTIDLTNMIADKAEKLNHHPDIHIYDFNRIKIVIQTHESNIITDLDIKLAQLIDQLL